MAEREHDAVLAIVDLGSNSARLVLYKLYRDGAFKLIDEFRESVRLAELLDGERVFGPAAFDRAAATLGEFSRICAAHRAKPVVAVATAAIRAARNGAALVEHVERSTGIRLTIISGEQEARYDYLGVVNSLNVADCTVVDVGGGSAQVVRVDSRQVRDLASLPLGALSLTREFLPKAETSPSNLQRLDRHVTAMLRSLPWLTRGGSASASAARVSPAGRPYLVGLGGTVRNIAKIYKKEAGYPLDLLHGLTIPAAALDELDSRLRRLTVAERRQVPGLSSTRADIIVAGITVVRSLVRAVDADTLLISGRGIRDGLLVEHLLGEGSLPVVADPVMFAVQNLMRFYDVGEAHARHVAELGLSLFDQTFPVHGLGPAERRLLEVAGLLHDIGVAISFYGHEENGLYLLTRAGIDGLTHRELLIVAYTVAGHTGKNAIKKWPTYRSMLDDRDVEVLSRLSGILTIAEALDRNEAGSVRSIRAQVQNGGKRIRLEPDVADSAVWALRELEDRLPDAERSLGVRLVLDAVR